jgi:hypothetical protein
MQPVGQPEEVPVNREQPLYLKVYFDPVYVEVARAVGYAGCTYRELTQKIERLAKQFDKPRVESALYHLVTFEGQMTSYPPPLAKVELRAHVRKLCWGLLGPPPEHPWYHYIKTGTPIPQSWAEPAKPKEKPKKRPKRQK